MMATVDPMPTTPRSRAAYAYLRKANVKQSDALNIVRALERGDYLTRFRIALKFLKMPHLSNVRKAEETRKWLIKHKYMKEPELR